MIRVIDQVRWLDLAEEIAARAEKKYNLRLSVDQCLLDEVAAAVKKSLGGYNMDSPNPAKVAGHVCFWFRRLKPIFHKDDSPARLHPINEWIALHLGLAICKEYFDDTCKVDFSVPGRILIDWVVSLHVNSHSPHSLAIAFELLTCAE